MVRTEGYSRCDGCGKRKKRDGTRLVAYRSISSRSGPFLAERLCPLCIEWYSSCGYWLVRMLEPMEQVRFGIVYKQAPLV